MQFDGDAITIDVSMNMEEIVEFEAFIRPRIEYIEQIDVEENGPMQCSALLGLLSSLKKSRRELSIPFIEKGYYSALGLGTIFWVVPEER